ncbi:MAG: two-component sensor histidine kinase [Helicobacteraceae bacterium]|jgi:signal transduction histidine kinase|nr:two-component sensor histidine kinase [Helicobacteraceae bacterium]
MENNDEKLLNEFPTYIAEMDKLIAEVSKDIIEQRKLLSKVIEVAPTAFWVLERDKNIYLSNETARKSGIDLQSITIGQDGKEIEINSRFFVLQVTEHDDRLIITASDNTNFRRHERLIAMGQMAAHLAHEIRNPIGAISNYASALFNSVPLKERQIVLEIKKIIWRVERIVKATLLFSRGFTLNLKKFVLSDLIEELKNSISNYSYTKDIKFDFSLQKIEIKGDFDLLLLVLQNMAFNAIDAIEESADQSGAITIRSAADYEIEIYDTGKKFENPERLFEAFYSSKTKGHGLGLILCKQIVEAHKGAIALLEDGKKGFLIKLARATD